MTVESSLSRELALCIGLAAKALPEVSLKNLVNQLTSRLGLPLTREKIIKLELGEYQALLNREFICSDIRKSFIMLKEGDRHAQLSAANSIKLYREGDMPHSIRVAIASENGIHTDGQFSLSQKFYIFQVSANEYRLIAIRAADTKQPMKADQKQAYRAELLQDCHVLYCQNIGGSAAAKVVNQGVHPMQTGANALVADTILALQTVLNTSPPPWLAKSMGKATPLANYASKETS